MNATRDRNLTAELINTYRGAVMQWHCDQMGHMNVMWYVGKFDEGIWSLFAMMGISATYLRAEDQAKAAVDQRIQYRRELLAGDTLTIGSGVLEIEPKSITIVHEMRHALSGEIAATCRLWACTWAIPRASRNRFHNASSMRRCR